jgi:predicted ATPase
MAAYGNYGPGYIGTAEAYTQGGYETSFTVPVSRVSPRVESVLTDAMHDLLR